MSSYQLILFTVAAILGTLMILDRNIGDYIDIKLKHLVVQVKLLMMRVKFEIELSPLGQWWMLRKYQKIAQELEKELTSK